MNKQSKRTPTRPRQKKDDTFVRVAKRCFQAFELFLFREKVCFEPRLRRRLGSPQVPRAQAQKEEIRENNTHEMKWTSASSQGLLSMLFDRLRLSSAQLHFFKKQPQQQKNKDISIASRKLAASIHGSG